MRRVFTSLALGCLCLAAAAQAAPAPARDDLWNMQIIGRNDLGGIGKGGEGLALKQYKNGRRILYLAHEEGPMCFSVLDVTDPAQPKLLVQVPVEAKFVRCNSLGLAGDTMVVAHQVLHPGQPYAGLDVYSIADPEHPQKLSHFDTSGPFSRGAHFVWFTDGHYAYASTGAKDFVPYNQRDDQFLMIVDVSDPRHPREAGRWWLPGMRVGDDVQLPRVDKPNEGIRMHSLDISPAAPNRAYIGWIDGGIVVLDISDKAHPKLIAHRSWASAGNGFAHTVLPIPSRHLLVQTEEATGKGCEMWPKRIWLWDDSNEKAPYPLSVLPPPKNLAEFCAGEGRFGAHNIQMNRPIATSRTLNETVVGSFFAGGVRAYSIADPYHPVEIGYAVPAAPPANASHSIQINDVYVDEHGLIYANDRFSGGLYVIRYAGRVPLD